jgi:hypothetical protein
MPTNLIGYLKYREASEDYVGGSFEEDRGRSNSQMILKEVNRNRLALKNQILMQEQSEYKAELLRAQYPISKIERKKTPDLSGDYWKKKTLFSCKAPGTITTEPSPNPKRKDFKVGPSPTQYIPHRNMLSQTLPDELSVDENPIHPEVKNLSTYNEFGLYQNFHNYREIWDQKYESKKPIITKETIPSP